MQPLLNACVDRVAHGSRFDWEYRTILELADRYPADPGVLVSLLMNRVVLEPGQALYLPPGNLHAYLSGTGVEIMANSDNVLRGGLTAKHVDIPELNRVLDFDPLDVNVMDGMPETGGERTYPVPTAQFSISRLGPVRATAPAVAPRAAGAAGGPRKRRGPRRCRRFGGGPTGPVLVDSARTSRFVDQRVWTSIPGERRFAGLPRGVDVRPATSRLVTRCTQHRADARPSTSTSREFR